MSEHTMKWRWWDLPPKDLKREIAIAKAELDELRRMEELYLGGKRTEILVLVRKIAGMEYDLAELERKQQRLECDNPATSD